MDTILDFLVDNYIWVLIIGVFLILVLLGYIADQKKKLNKIKEQKEESIVNSEININVPVQEEVQNQTVAPAPVAAEPVINEPVINEVSTIETPTFEPINEVEVATVPIEEPIIEQPVTEIQSEPIVEETPQTVLDIPENVTDIQAPVVESTEIIEEPEIIEEVETPQNVVNTWEPELVQENKDIASTPEIKDSI